MNKILTRITAACLTFAMGIGVGVAVGLSNKKPAKALHAVTAGDVFSRISAAGDLADGDEIIFVNQAEDYACGTTQNTNNRTPVAITTSESSYTYAAADNVQVFTVKISGANYGFHTGSGYIYSASSSNNYLKTNSTAITTAPSGTSAWGLTVAANGVCTITNKTNTSYYLAFNGTSYFSAYKSGQTKPFIYKKGASFGELDHIKITTPATKTTFEEGESFSTAGLVITAYDAANEAEANTRVYSSGYTTDYDAYKTTPFAAGDVGENKVVTVSYGGKSATYTITVEAGPDFILDGNTNKPAGVSSSTNTDVGEGQVGGAGVKYGYYALQTYSDNLEFNKDTSGAYIGNNESYGKYLKKIRVTLSSANNFNKLTMYKGNTPIPGSASVSPNEDTGTTRTYNLNDDSEYFALKQTTTGAWIQISKIEVFLGSVAIQAEIDSVIGAVKDGTYYVGSTLSASDLEVTVKWTNEKPDTHPVDGFTFTVNGNANGQLVEGVNNVVVTYQGHDSATFTVLGIPATQSSLSYSDYVKHEGTGAVDELDKEATGITGTSYGDWTKTDYASGVDYAGNSAPNNNSIQLNDSDSNKGVITTANEKDIAATKLTITWEGHTAKDRVLEVYGKNTPYEGVTDLFDGEKQGDLITTFKYDKVHNTVEYTFEAEYKYLGFRSQSGAMYISEIAIQWGTLTTYDYSNLAIRFSGVVKEDLWNAIDDIQGYGVLLGNADFIDSDPSFSLQAFYDSPDGTDIRKYTNANTVHEPALKETPTLKNGNYLWNLYYRISFENVQQEYIAAAFIITTSKIIFLDEIRVSAKSLAYDLIDSGAYPADAFGGSLSHLANA